MEWGKAYQVSREMFHYNAGSLLDTIGETHFIQWQCLFVCLYLRHIFTKCIGVTLVNMIMEVSVMGF